MIIALAKRSEIVLLCSSLGAGSASIARSSDALGVSFDPHIGHDFLDNYADRYDFYHRKRNHPLHRHYHPRPQWSAHPLRQERRLVQGREEVRKRTRLRQGACHAPRLSSYGTLM